jgi:hypothetical protein
MSVSRCGCALLVLFSLGAPAAMAADQPLNTGFLNANGRKVQFKHVVAIPGDYFGEPRIMVLATGQAVSADVIKAVGKKNPEDNVDREVGQPYLKGVFDETGKLVCVFGMGAQTSFGTRGAPLTGEATIKDGQIEGSLSLIETGTFAKEVQFRFQVPVGTTAATPAPKKLDPPVMAKVDGKYLGNGKPATLKFVSVYDREPFSDQAAIEIVFTEQDHTKSAKPGFDAGFGKFGSALVLSVHLHDGGIFGCEVVHKGLTKPSISAVGEIHFSEFETAGGNVVGHVATDKEVEFFGDRWIIDLKFAAPMPEALRTKLMQPEVAKKESSKTARSNKDDDDDADMPEKPVVLGPPAYQLPLPKDATNLEYKALVKQIRYERNVGVPQAAAELAAALKAAGWKDGIGGVNGVNTIMHKVHGDSKLTIFVKPIETGSTVQLMTDGLDWKTGAPTEEKGAKKKKKTSAKKEVDDAEQKALDLIKEAVPGLPKGLLDEIEKELKDDDE